VARVPQKRGVVGAERFVDEFTIGPARLVLKTEPKSGRQLHRDLARAKDCGACYPERGRLASQRRKGMDRDTELGIVRRAYAKQIIAAAGTADRRVEAAFGAVRREHFLGAGPWPILRWDRGYVPTPTRNPVYL